jgi:hypothetical protein
MVIQFIKARHQEVTESIIRGATAGMKEADASLTTVLNDLFSPMAKKRVKELGLTEEEETRYVTRLAFEIDGSGRDASVALGKDFSKLDTLVNYLPDTTSQDALDTTLHCANTTLTSLDTRKRTNGLFLSIRFLLRCIPTATLLWVHIWRIPWFHSILFYKRGVTPRLNEIKKIGM